MNWPVGNRMKLNSLEQGVIFFSVQLQFLQFGLGDRQNFFEINLGDGEVEVFFHPWAVKNSRHTLLISQCIGVFLSKVSRFCF